MFLMVDFSSARNANASISSRRGLVAVRFFDAGYKVSMFLSNSPFYALSVHVRSAVSEGVL